MRQLRGRFAPSPSGEMHLGNIWTALLAWLGVRHSGGIMVLRIEDLDPDRSRPEYTQQIMSDLRWLGLDWDEGPDCGGPFVPYTQDERRNLYENAIKELNYKGLLYPCFCSRAQLHSPTLAPHACQNEWRYPGTCRFLSEQEQYDRLQQGRRPMLRICVPDAEYCLTDLIQGEFKQNLQSTCGDFTIRRADGVHAYQLAVVIDDALMQISQVVRGADLLPSTPRQLFLYEALGLTPPAFAHVPLLIDPVGQRLSKRQQSLSLAALRANSVSPEAIIGFLAWKAGLIDKCEQVRAEELVPSFSFMSLRKDPVVIDVAEIC